MAKNKAKKAIATLTVVSSLLAGGYVVSTTTQPLTLDEYYALVEIMNYEIQNSGESVTLQNVKGDPINAMLDKLITFPVPEDGVVIAGQTFSKEEYMKLREGLFKKAKKSH